MEFSTLSTLEMVRLKASLMALDETHYQCVNCLKMYSNIPNGKIKTEKMREAKGCVKVLDHTVKMLNPGIRFRTCPGNFFDSSIGYILKMFSAYEKGTMPFDGALVDQPNKIIDIFAIIEAVKAEQIEKKNAAMKANLSANQRGRSNG